MKKLLALLSAAVMGVMVVVVVSLGIGPAKAAPGSEPTSRCTRITYPKKTPKTTPTGPGARCTRLYAKHKDKILPNQAPTLDLIVSPVNGNKIPIAAKASDADGDLMLYTYSATGGRITGDGPEASWDISGLAPGSYTVTAEIDDGCGCMTMDSASVTIPPAK